MTPMPTALMIELRDIFAAYFNLEELSDFALALGVDYENLPGSNKRDKARELVTYLNRHDMLERLGVVGPLHRPDIRWLEILGRNNNAFPKLKELTNELTDMFRNQLSYDETTEIGHKLLGNNFENVFFGEVKDHAFNLTSYLIRHGLIGKLATYGPSLRSDIPWLEILDRNGFVSPANGSIIELPIPRLTGNPVKLTPQGLNEVINLAESFIQIQLAQQMQSEQDEKLTQSELKELVNILTVYPLFQTPDGRNTVLIISGVSPFISLDLNGRAQDVAASLVEKLNALGEIDPGDTAIGRLLSYLASDETLPLADRNALRTIASNRRLLMKE